MLEIIKESQSWNNNAYEIMHIKYNISKYMKFKIIFVPRV